MGNNKRLRSEVSLISGSILAFLALSNVLYFIFYVITSAPGDSVPDLFAQLVAYLWGITASIFILRGNSPEYNLKGSGAPLSRYALSISCAIFFPVQLLAYEVETLLNGVGLTSASAVEGNYDKTFSVFVLLFLSQAVCPAFFEEILFRGAILQRLRKYGDVFAIIVSALFFTLLHTTLSSIPSIFLMGVLFAYVDIKCESIYPSILMHFINNALAVIFTWTDGTLFSSYLLRVLMYASIVGITHVGIGILKGVFHDRTATITKGSSPLKAFTSIPFLFLILVMVIMTARMTEAAV